MAFGLTIADDTGVDVTYWRVTDMRFNALTGKVRVIVSGYLDEATRNDGKLPVSQKISQFNLLSYDLTVDGQPCSNVKEFLYDQLKQLDEWVDASDLL